METPNQIPTRQCVTTSIGKAIQTGLQVRQINDDVEIRKALLYVYSLIGLRPDNYPTPSEDSVLIKVIKEKYAGYTLDEIRLAFTMAVSRELNESLSVDHYQKFSAEYLGRIMSAYKVFRIEEIKKQNQKPNYEQPMIDTEQYFITFLIEPYEKFLKDNKYPYSHLDGWMFYNRLHKLIGLTEEERQEYKDQARAITMRKPIGQETDEAYNNRVKNIGKHLAFKNWIETKAFEEWDMRGFFIDKFEQRKNK